MRLICPNCDAQYEVPDEVIPAEGRDVQCSNCGQTWFQPYADAAADEAQAEEAPFDQPDPDEETYLPTAEEEVPAEPPAPRRRELDPSVADILRQEAEAEQEARARQREYETLESQPELGLPDGEERGHHYGAAEYDEDDDEAAVATRAARERMARLRGEPTGLTEAEATAAALSSRRDLLPDIDEINSTLRSAGEREGRPVDPGAAAVPTQSQNRKRGFRSGLLAALSIAAVLGVVYVFAPEIAVNVPQTDPYISAYVSQVDQARFWLDGQVEGMLRWLDALATQSAG